MTSYAAIAKGQSMSKQSSAVVSGTTTPASSIPELAAGTNWADDVESKDSAPSESQASTDISSVPSTQVKSSEAETVQKSSQTTENSEDDTNTDSTVEMKTSTPQAGETSKSTEEGKKEDVTEKPAKPVFTEAKPPSVNIWAKRAAEQKAKVVTPLPNAQSASQSSAPKGADHGSKFDNRRKSEQPFASRDIRRGEPPARARGDFRGSKSQREQRPEDVRRGPAKPRDRATSDLLPPTTSQASWPKPTDVSPTDEKKRFIEEKDRVIPSASIKHGKPVWEHVPFTPTAVFETRIEGKPSARMGKGSGRPAGPRGPQQVSPEPHRLGGRTQANGDHGKNAPAAVSPVDREYMPPHGRSQPGADQPKQPESTLPNGVSHGQSSEVAPTESADSNGPSHAGQTLSKEADQTDGKPSSREIASADKQSSGEANKKQSQHPQDCALSLSGQNDTGANGEQTPRPYTERRSEPSIYDGSREAGNSFRETKRGGRKGGRGGFNNFSSPNPYAAGYDAFPSGQMPLSPTGGNFFPSRGGSHGGRGYRNHGIRSQSIPIEYGRPGAYPGYPMMPMQPFMPDFYGPYGAPYPVNSTAGKELLIVNVLSQVEYYFSIDNLLKDLFLRKHMNSEGWIFLQVIAQFNRMKQMTTDYEILRQACLRSNDVEIRVGPDGKDRVRRVHEWDQWILPMQDRDAAAQGETPQGLRRPSPVRNQFFEQQMNGARGESFQLHDAAAAPSFFPGQMDPRFADFQPSHMEESRGRQARPHHRENASPTNGYAPVDDEADRFPTSQIDGLTVVVRRHDVDVTVRPLPHHATSRTFSNGSIDSGNIMEEVMNARVPALTNGTGSPHSSPTKPGSEVDLFWVKDRADPVDSAQLPDGTTGELYTILRSKALAQRDAAATGTCPYDLDVLYQFWSHFLIRNFNAQMYHEFKTLATDDATQRHSSVGLINLTKYYSEALSNQISIRESVVRDYTDLIKSETGKTSRPAFAQLAEAWRNGSLNLKNRKKLGDFLDEALKTELDS